MSDLKQLDTLITQAHQLINKINEANIFEALVEKNTELLNKINMLEKELEAKTKILNDLKLKYDHDIDFKNNELKEKSEELKNLTKVSFIQSLNKQVNDKNLIIQQLENQITRLKASQVNENNFSVPICTELIGLNNDLIDEPKIKKDKSKKKVKKDEETDEHISQKLEKQPDAEPKAEEPDNHLEPEPDNHLEPDPEPSLEPDPEPIPEKILKKKKEKQPKSFDIDNFEDINGYELLSYKKKYYLRDLETNELYNIIDNNPGEIIGLLTSNGKVKFN